MRIRAHLPAVALFAVLALVWSSPLILHMTTHLPGAPGPGGDNVCFVWNLWWMRTAIHEHVNPFYTTYMFHPVGVNLVQNTHTAFSGLVAASVLAGLSPLAAQNVLILAALFLNGLLAYLLAWRICGDRMAALAAGVVFGGAAPILCRLSGHFNLLGAWVLPLAALVVLRAFDRKTVGASVAAGAVLAGVAYCEYYYAVYALVFLAVCVADRWIRAGVGLDRRPPNRASRVVVALLVVDVAVMALIIVTGGLSLHVGGLHLRMSTTFNERVAFWALLAVWILTRWRVAMHAQVRPDATVKRDLQGVSIMAASFAVVAAPLIAGAIRLLLEGDYTSPQYGWRSAPPGVDVASFVVGNPLHLLYGSWTRRAYAAVGMNPVEGVAYISVTALAIVATGWRRLRRTPETVRWQVSAVLFTVWALGPHLDVFGTIPGVVLPAALLRFVPLVANAREPSRAMAMAALAVAMLLALTLSQRARHWSRGLRGVVAALLLAEMVTGPLPLYRPEPSSIYPILAAQPAPGAVLELPLGLRDGLGEIGHFDTRTLYYQTISGRPVLGGYVSRLSSRVKSWYLGAPVISTVLKLSDSTCPPNWTPEAVTPRQAYDALTAASVRYVVVDRASSSPRLLAYVSSWPMTRLAADSGRELYVLRKP